MPKVERLKNELNIRSISINNLRFALGSETESVEKGLVVSSFYYKLWQYNLTFETLGRLLL